jgi:peptidoglycan/LPS O-acetylase OafA/YrhL
MAFAQVADMLTKLIPAPGATRLVLAVTVVVSHYFLMSGNPLAVPADAVAVDGFFFLSGYWIARLWNERYLRCRGPLFTFYCSRLLRIYPIATASTLLMFWVAGGSWDQLLSNLVLIDAVQGEGPLNPPSWSIAIELQFYAIAPLLVVLLRNNIAAVAVLTTGLAFWLIYATGVMHIFVANFIFLFGLGIWFSNRARHETAARLVPFCLAGILIFCLVAGIPAVQGELLGYGMTRRLAGIALGMLCLPCVAASLSKKSHSFDRVLGDLSYPVYLFHWPAFVIAGRLIATEQIPLAVGLTVVVTLFAYTLIDRPFEIVRYNFVESRKKVARDP